MRNAAAKHSLIVGLGATGAAVARYLTARGERVRVIDSRANPPGLDELRAAVPGVDVSLETLDERWLDDASRVLLSPGLPYDLPLAVEARRRGLAVIGDIELFALAARAPVIAVTGSNGKSTVTTLASKMLESQRLRAPAGGNLGPPALDLLERRRRRVRARDLELPDGDDRQLGAARGDGAQRLGGSSRSARHARALRRAQRETAAGGRARRRQRRRPARRGDGRAARARRAVLRASELARGYSIVVQRGERWLARDRKPLLRSAELGHARHAQRSERARGARADGASSRRISTRRSTCCARSAGLPHRCQRVAERKGVTFVDDSKGTNVGATLAALNGLAGPLVLIAGGLSKGQDLAPLAAGARGKLRAAVLIGAAADELERVLAPVCQTVRAHEHGRCRRARGRARAARRHGAAVAGVREPRHVPRLSRARRAIRARGAGAADVSAVVKPNAVAFDAPLICAVVGLIAMGTIMVTSASVSIVAGEPLHYLVRHLGAVARGARRARARRLAADGALVSAELAAR